MGLAGSMIWILANDHHLNLWKININISDGGYQDGLIEETINLKLFNLVPDQRCSDATMKRHFQVMDRLYERIVLWRQIDRAAQNTASWIRQLPPAAQTNLPIWKLMGCLCIFNRIEIFRAIIIAFNFSNNAMFEVLAYLTAMEFAINKEWQERFSF